MSQNGIAGEMPVFLALNNATNGLFWNHSPSIIARECPDILLTKTAYKLDTDGSPIFFHFPYG